MGESSEKKKKSLNHLDFILFARMDNADNLKFPEGFKEKGTYLPFQRCVENTEFESNLMDDMLRKVNEDDKAHAYQKEALTVLCTNDFIVLIFRFYSETDVGIKELAKFSPRFIRIAQNNENAYLRRIAAAFLNQLAEENNGILPQSIIMQSNDGLTKMEFNPDNLIYEKFKTNDTSKWYESSPFFIFADLNEKDFSNMKESEFDKEIEKDFVRIASGRSNKTKILEEECNGSILHNAYSYAFQSGDGLTNAQAFSRYESFLKEYERALLDKIRTFQYINDIERLRNGAEFSIGEYNREYAYSILSAARNFSFQIQHRISYFQKSKNIAHDLYSSFMETSGASDEIGNLSSICQRLQEAIKIYDDKVREAKKEENERIERKRTLMLNFIAIFAIVSAFKDGADLIISSIDSFMDDSLPIALKSIKFALYLFAIFWLYPILKKLITCLNSTNNEDNLTRGFVMQKAKLAAIFGIMSGSGLCILLECLM